MSAAELDAYLAAAEDAAREAGKLIRAAHIERADGLAGVVSKGPADQHVDLVTATDKACEDLIIGRLSQRFPDHAFIGEESAKAASGPLVLGAQPTWIIDPLDGTTNFVHGYPFVTVSIGLAVGGELCVGVIYNPLMDELCAARRGSGTRLNGQPSHVGTATGVTTALVCNNMGASREPAVNALCTARLLALLQASVRGLRNSGSAAQNMMHVACGRLDAYFEDGFGGPWDVAAGRVIVEEAGGIVRMVRGEQFTLMAGKGQVLCGNPAVVEGLAAVLGAVPIPTELA